MAARGQRNRIVRWIIDGGLAPGASITLTYQTTVDQSGDFTNAACAAGHDQYGNETTDCADVTVTQW